MTSACQRSHVNVLPPLARSLRVLKAQVLEFDRCILAWHRPNETSKRLDVNRRRKLTPGSARNFDPHLARMLRR